MKKLSLILLFLIATFQGEAQSKIDSYKAKLKTAKNDTLHCFYLLKLVDETDDDEWPAFNQALKIFSQQKLKDETTPEKERTIFKRYLAEAINNEGFLKLYEGKAEEALHFFQQSIDLNKSIQNLNGIAITYNNMGAIYENQGNIVRALEYYDQSLKIKEKTKNIEGIASSLNNIGLIYTNLTDYSNALLNFERGLKYETKLKNKAGIARVNHNIGYIYAKQKRYLKAKKYFDIALHIFEELNDLQGISYCIRSLGEVYEKTGNEALAYTSYEKSLDLRKKLNDKKGIASSLYDLSNLQYKQKKFQESKKNALESFAIAKELGYPDIIRNASSQLYKIYKSENNYVKSLEMLEIFKKMNDSIYNLESKKASSRHQVSYEFQRKAEKLKRIQEKKELTFKNKSKNLQIVIFSIAVLLLFTFIFLRILFKRFKISQEQKELISQKELETQKQKHILEEKNAEITDSIRYAKRIQSAILPADKFIKSLFPESFVFYKPKDIVAGDFYWFDKIDNLIFFAVADCTGHGVPGAMVSVVCHNALNRSIREFKLATANEILDKSREIVCAEFGKSDEEVNDGMDISLGVFNLTDWTLSWSGANNPLWIYRNLERIELKGDKQPVGNFSKPTPFTHQLFQLQKNDLIYCFSDGYPDQFGGPLGKKYKIKQFKETLDKIHTVEMSEQLNLLETDFKNWMGKNEQVDDICVLGVKI